MNSSLFKKFKLEEFEEKQIIFNCGDIGIKYYIIING